MLDEIVRALWFGMTGRAADVRRVVSKGLEQWRSTQPLLAERVDRLLTELAQHPARSPVREVPTAVEAPVDPESRLQLLQINPSPTLAFDPIWSKELTTELSLLVNERHAAHRLEQAGLAPTRTVLFTGPPGVGKTLAANWMAMRLELPLYVLSLSTVVSSLLGRTGGNLRNVFAFAQSRPCVLFLDELDAIAKRRDDDTDIGELKRLVTVLLQEIDAWPAGSLLVAATNHESLLDQAVWRRFEVQLHFALPTVEQLRQALMLYLGEDQRAGIGDVATLVAAAHVGLSFSDFAHVISRARRECVLTGTDMRSKLVELAASRSKALSRTDREAVLRLLDEASLGQREIHRLTGLARETIRKATKVSRPTQRRSPR